MFKKKEPGKAVSSIDANNKLCALPLAGHPHWHQHVPDPVFPFIALRMRKMLMSYKKTQVTPTGTNMFLMMVMIIIIRRMITMIKS